MLVKDVIKLAANLLGREDLSTLADRQTEASGEVIVILQCYNVIENEVALDFFPLKETERFTPEGGESPLHGVPLLARQYPESDG